MKKFNKYIMLAVFTIFISMGMLGCSGEKKGPSGVYTVGDKVTYIEFDGENVTLQLGQLSAVGKWELDNDKLTITYDNNAGVKEYIYNAEDDTIEAPSGEILTKIE